MEYVYVFLFDGVPDAAFKDSNAAMGYAVKMYQENGFDYVRFFRGAHDIKIQFKDGGEWRDSSCSIKIVLVL